MATATKPFPLISKSEASYVFWPETEYRCADECINLKSQQECAILGALVQIDAPAGSCDYYIHGGKTDWQMPVTGCITKESAGYAENPSRQGFGCKRCKWFDADGLDCYRGVDKQSEGPAPGIIHPNGCCNLNDPDAVRGKMTREQLTELFEKKGFTEAARLSMSTVSLTPGFQVLAFKLQEASMMHSDVASRLRDAVNDAHQGTGKYGYYIDHDGDGEEGTCVYSSSGDIRQAPYEIGSRGGKAVANIDMQNSKNVVPRMTYEEEGDDSDHYTAMESQKLYEKLPVYERFIPAKTRKAADSGSFAGKSRSFPILKAEDVSAALHSLGRAGSGNYDTGTIRSNIKRIAKAKGFALPDSLKDDASEGARRSSGTGGNGSKHGAIDLGSLAEDLATFLGVSRETLHQSTWKPDGALLVEKAVWSETPQLKEAATAHFPIKLMSPGRGSSGYYPPDTLKRAAESNVFKAGTQMFWNHDTDAEESARPEGDLNRLAAVTTSDAKWQENGHDGPGLYANAKVFADYAEKVKEMGPHIGLSIRAGGERNESAIAPDGKPRVITALKNAASVDFVTRAGRDGKIFTESATREGEDMDKAEIQALIKESLTPLQAENKQLREMLAATRGPALIGKHLADIRLPEKAKQKITEALSLSIPLTESGAVDDAKLKTMVEAAATEWAETLRDMGIGVNPASFGKRITEAELLPIAEAMDRDRDEVFEGLAEIFVGKKLTKGSVDEEKRALRKQAREAFKEGRAA